LRKKTLYRKPGVRRKELQTVIEQVATALSKNVACSVRGNYEFGKIRQIRLAGLPRRASFAGLFVISWDLASTG